MNISKNKGKWIYIERERDRQTEPEKTGLGEERGEKGKKGEKRSREKIYNVIALILALRSQQLHFSFISFKIDK